MELIATVEALCIRELAKHAPLSYKSLIELSLEGVVGDVHFGFTKPADGRDTGIQRGTTIRNWRQWTAVSVEELAIIAERMGLDKLDPRLLSANITFSGVANLTALPKGTTIHFEDGPILSVEGENQPCVGPGKEMSALYPQYKPHEFVSAARRLRGTVGVIHRAGFIKVGDRARIRIYEERHPQTHLFRNMAEPLPSAD